MSDVRRPAWCVACEDDLADMAGRMPTSEQVRLLEVMHDTERRNAILTGMIQVAAAGVANEPPGVALQLIAAMGISIAGSARIAMEGGKTDGNEDNTTAGQPGGRPPVPPS